MNDATYRDLETTKGLDYEGKQIILTFRRSMYYFTSGLIYVKDATMILLIIVYILCLRLILELYNYIIPTSRQRVLTLKAYGEKS